MNIKSTTFAVGGCITARSLLCVSNKLVFMKMEAMLVETAANDMHCIT